MLSNKTPVLHLFPVSPKYLLLFLFLTSAENKNIAFQQFIWRIITISVLGVRFQIGRSSLTSLWLCGLFSIIFK